MIHDSVGAAIAGNSYPGRGIFIGLHADGRRAAVAYFIMGRSENSRNRVFAGGSDPALIHTEAFDSAKLSDPTLVIYNATRRAGGVYIVTNGDQTDTIADFIEAGGRFEDALRTRTFEPDPPIFTPRISGILDFSGGGMSYKLSILKCVDAASGAAGRYFYEYDRPVAGVGHLIHTYKSDGDPVPSFEGEPVAARVTAGGVEEFARDIWAGLDENNRVSLFACFLPIGGGDTEQVIINRHNAEV